MHSFQVQGTMHIRILFPIWKSNKNWTSNFFDLRTLNVKKVFRLCWSSRTRSLKRVSQRKVTTFFCNVPNILTALNFFPIRKWKKQFEQENFEQKYHILERALRALASSSGGAACPRATWGQPWGSTPGVRGWFQGDLSEKKILWHTDARTDARTEGRTDVSIEIVI